ncbi:MAG: MASE1 domain-containing protein [Gammaproteobacteria bacterium]|nr:MASE1 domain-containing protein [Gammaproteobacteria bacterium]
MRFDFLCAGHKQPPAARPPVLLGRDRDPVVGRLQRRAQPALLIATLAVVYILAGKFGLHFAAVHRSASAVWPPTGIALAAVLIFGYRVWPAILLGAFVVNVTTTGVSLTSLAIAFGNTLEGITGAYLVNRFAGGPACFERAKNVFIFVGLAALFSTMVSATVGVSSLTLGGYAQWSDVAPIWLTWWLGDAAGALIVTPLLMHWHNNARDFLRSGRLLEAMLMLVVVVAVGVLLFVAPVFSKYPLTFLCLPPLVWAAFRFGQREVTAAVALLTLIATLATSYGYGPFALLTRNESLLLLQVFMGTIAVTTLPIAALVMERQRGVIEREALRAAAERQHVWLEAVLQQMQAAVIIAEAPSGRLVYANKQVEKIHRRPFVQTDSCADYSKWQGFHPNGCPYTPDEWPLARSVHDGEVVADEDMDFIRGDGSRVTVRVHSTPLRDAGQVVGAVAVYNDVTEQLRAHASERSARAEAEAANRAKDEFLAMLSHELRNPLSAISNATSVLYRTRNSAEGIPDRVLDIIRRQTDHLTRLMNDLLDVTRVTSGKNILVRRPMCVGEALARCVAALTDAGRCRSHAIDVHTESVWANVDHARLDQIITNLLTNALKYTPAGGTIRVSAQREHDTAVIRVQDNGIGIPSDLLPHVFDLFTQGACSIDRGAGGLGIGLTLVQRLVEQHGGRVEGHSDGPGCGSLFVVRLPCIAPPQHDRSVIDVAIPLPPVSRRVLIIEDNADARESLRVMLEIAGHEVYQAEDGHTGIERALALRPDVALIDIGLPRINGYEVARKLKLGDPGLRLIALTGYGRSDDRERALQAGFDEHLVKPANTDELNRVLRGAKARTLNAGDRSR